MVEETLWSVVYKIGPYLRTFMDWEFEFQVGAINWSSIYRVSQEKCARLRENVP